MNKSTTKSIDAWQILRIQSEFTRAFDEMSDLGPCISIFGSARTNSDDKWYEEARIAGSELVGAGFGVITGGGPGIMEAANKGAYEINPQKSFGLGIELAGLVDSKAYKETKYLNPIEVAQDLSRILKHEQKCDLVICLSHLGYKYNDEKDKISDVKLATLTKDIDLIIGGHTHTFLEKPTILKNSEGKEVIVNQAGCYGINMGRIDFYFDNDQSKSHNGRSIII